MALSFAAGGASAVIAVAKPPQGRPFRPTHEAAMLPVVIQMAIARAGVRGRILVVPEFRGPYGVVDIAVLETDDAALEARIALGVPPLVNQIDAAIVGSLAVHKPRSLDAVARANGWPVRHLVTRAERLRRLGVISQGRSGCFVRPHGLAPLGHLSAYEAKVSDWRQGFVQAVTYATWADESTLALDRLPGLLSTVKSTAHSLRVGLIADGRWEEKPERQQLTMQTRLWASEHLFASVM